MRYAVLFLSFFLLGVAGAEEPARVLERAEERLQRFRQLSPNLNGYNDLVPLLADRDISVEALEYRYELIRGAVLKPHFAPPQNWDSDPDKLDGYYIRLLRVCDATIASGKKREQAGDLDGALQRYETGILLGARFSGQGPLVYQMVSVGVSKKALASYQELVSSGALSTAQCSRALGFLEKMPVEESDFLDSSEMELAFLHSSIRAGKGSEQDLGRFQKVYFDTRNEFSDLQPGKLPTTSVQPESEELRDYYDLFHSGAISWRSHLTRLSAVKIIAALRAYHSEEGEFPESLELLVPHYLERVPPSYLSPHGDFRYSPQREIGFRLDTLSEFGEPLGPEDLRYYPPPKVAPE